MGSRGGGGGGGGGRGGSRPDAQRTMDEFEELAGLRAGTEGDGVERGEGGDAERAAYVLEHLATFTVTRETGILYPADGMRRLLQLEKSNGIWSQKMQLCLEGQWVLVMDYETGSIMERFPASWVHSPTAFTSPEPGELYNNVVAFVVGAPSPSAPSAPSAPEPAAPRRELHIFQCHDVAAHTLVEELNALKGIGAGAGEREPARDFTIERERERERESDAPRRQRHLCDAIERNDDASSTGSEHEIAILNRCFDDIEKFIARLQHAAAASRELERRAAAADARRSQPARQLRHQQGDRALALAGRRLARAQGSYYRQDFHLLDYTVSAAYKLTRLPSCWTGSRKLRFLWAWTFGMRRLPLLLRPVAYLPKLGNVVRFGYDHDPDFSTYLPS